MNARQVDGGSGTPAEALDGLVVALEAADADGPAGGEPVEVIAHRDAPRGDRAGNHRAVAGDREGPVDRHPEEAGIVARGDRGTERSECLAEFLNPLAGHGRGLDDRGRFEKRTRHEGLDVVLDEGQPGGIGQVALGQHDEPGGEPEQAEDFQVLAGLRHHRVVGRDDEQGQVKAGRAGKHVANEPLVAGDVDERDPGVVAEVERGEPEVDGDPTLFFGGEPIRVNAGQGAHERGLAVVDVPRRADYQIAPYHPAKAPGGSVYTVRERGAMGRRAGTIPSRSGPMADGRSPIIAEGSRGFDFHAFSVIGHRSWAISGQPGRTGNGPGEARGRRRASQENRAVAIDRVPALR